MLKTKFYLALSLVIAISLLVGGSTLALFTAQTSSINQTFTASTLHLTSDRNDGDPAPGPMFYITGQQGQTPYGAEGIYPTGVWAPGDSFTRTLTISNPWASNGMDAWLESVQAELDPSSFAPMANKLYVEIFTPMNGQEVKVGEGYLGDLLIHPLPIAFPGGGKIPVMLGSNRHMKFKVTLVSSADNSCQDKTLIAAFYINAEQKKNNP